MADYELTVGAGNLGKDPEIRQTPRGPVVSLSIAQPVKFSKDAPDPLWFNAAVWDHGLQNVVKNTLRKGARVVVFGKRKEDRKGENGRIYRDIDVYRIGTVDFLFPLDKTPGQPARPSEAAVDDDDLPF